MTTAWAFRGSISGRSDPLGGALVPAIPDQLPRLELMLADRGVQVGGCRSIERMLASL